MRHVSLAALAASLLAGLLWSCGAPALPDGGHAGGSEGGGRAAGGGLAGGGEAGGLGGGSTAAGGGGGTPGTGGGAPAGGSGGAGVGGSAGGSTSRPAFAGGDRTFGDGGLLELTLPGDWLAERMTCLRDGGLLITGTIDAPDQRVWLARLSARGAVDPTFGVGGIVMLEGDRIASVGRPVPADDGAIFLPMSSEWPTTYREAKVFKLSESGELDPALGLGSGRLVTSSAYSSRLFFDADRAGRLLFVDGDTIPVMFSAAGVRMSGFGDYGAIDPALPDGGAYQLRGYRIRSDGGVRLAAVIPRAPPSDGLGLATMQLRDDGTYDPRFGIAGAALTADVGRQGQHFFTRALVSDDGETLFYGATLSSMNSALAAPLFARIRPDGALDTSFNYTAIKVAPLEKAGQFQTLIDLSADVDSKGRPVGLYFGGSLLSVHPASFFVLRLSRSGDEDYRFPPGGGGPAPGFTEFTEAVNQWTDLAGSICAAPDDSLYVLVSYRRAAGGPHQNVLLRIAEADAGLAPEQLADDGGPGFVDAGPLDAGVLPTFARCGSWTTPQKVGSEIWQQPYVTFGRPGELFVASPTFRGAWLGIWSDAGWSDPVFVDGGTQGLNVRLASTPVGEAHAIVGLVTPYGRTDDYAFFDRSPDGGFVLSMIYSPGYAFFGISASPGFAGAVFNLGSNSVRIVARRWANGSWGPVMPMDLGPGQHLAPLDGVSVDPTGVLRVLWNELTFGKPWRTYRTILTDVDTRIEALSELPDSVFLCDAKYDSTATMTLSRYAFSADDFEVRRVTTDSQMGPSLHFPGRKVETFADEQGVVRVHYTVGADAGRDHLGVVRDGITREVDLSSLAPFNTGSPKFTFNAAGDGYEIVPQGSQLWAAQVLPDGTLGPPFAVPPPAPSFSLSRFHVAQAPDGELFVVMQGTTDAGYGVFATSCR